MTLENKIIRIEYYDNGELDQIKSRDWLIEKSVDNVYKDKSYSVVLAYDISGHQPKNQYIYSYFPTRIEFPFPFLLHADFDLDSNRNHLIKNSANKEVLDKAAELIVSSSIEIFKNVSYDRLYFILPKYGLSSLSSELLDYRFDKSLLKYIEKKEVFPTVSKKYEIINPKSHMFYENDLSKYLPGNMFNNLLMYCDDYRVKKLIDALFGGKRRIYTYSYLSSALNVWVFNLSFNKRNINRISQIVYGIFDSYKDLKVIKKHSLSIFFNESEELISNENPIFIKDSKLVLSKLPRFAKIEFLNEKMVDSFKTTMGLEYNEVLDCFNIREYSLPDIVDAINKKIRSVSVKNKKRANDYSLQALEWLWRNKDSISGRINLLILSRDNKLIYSCDAYMGKEYNNEVGERIVSLINSESFVIDITKQFDAELSDISDFLLKLGIDKYPKRKKGYISNNSAYLKCVLSDLKYPYKIEYDSFDSVDSFVTALRSYSVSVEFIEQLDTIFDKANTGDIIEWIMNDPYIKGIISSKKETIQSNVYVRWGYQRDERVIKEIKRPYSYLLWKFQNRKWIQVGNNRYSVNECLLSLQDSVDLSPLLVKPEFEKYIKDFPGKKNKLLNEFSATLESVGVKRDFADLDVDKIYEVLLALPNYDVKDTIVRSFYENMIDDSEAIIKRINKSSFYNDFINNGKVLCNTGDYHNVSESLYVSGKDICGKLLKTFNIIDLPKGRKNFTSVPKLFGVKRVEIKGVKLESFIVSSANEKFQKDFEKYKQLAFSYRINAKRDEKKEARSFNRIKIYLCSSIVVSYDNQLFELDPYDFLLQGNNQYYYCIPEGSDIFDIKAGIGVSNIICSYLDVYGLESEFRELYTAKTYKNRRMILIENLGEDTVERSVKAMKGGSDTRDEFIQIINDISDINMDEVNEIIDDIDFENLNSFVNYETIIELFRILKIDLDVYNAADPSIRIDLTDYYSNKIQNELPKYYEAYRCMLYEKYKNSSIIEKSHLQSDILDFENINIQIINSVQFDYKLEIEKELAVDSYKIDYNITDIYNKNKKKLVKIYHDFDKDKLDDLLRNPEIASLLYYGELVEIHKYYGSMYPLEDEIEIKPEAGKEPAIVEPKVVKINKIKPAQSSSVSKRKKITATGYKTRSEDKKLEEIGLIGEKCVYNHIKNSVSNKNRGLVKWVSENAKSDGVNPEGAAGYGYDIEYVNDLGERCYVEVKTSTDSLDRGLSFYLSENEYKFAQENSAHYSIYYVAGIRSENPQMVVLDDVLIDGDFNSENYKMSVREYHIDASIEIDKDKILNSAL